MIDPLALTRSRRSIEAGARLHLLPRSGHRIEVADVIGFRERRTKGLAVHTWARVQEINERALAGMVAADLPLLGYALALYSVIEVRERLARSLHVSPDVPIRWIRFEVFRDR